MRKIKLNLNQRKAISESINNLAVLIIVIGIVTPIFSNSLKIINIIIVITVSSLLFILSNFMLE